MSPSPTRKGFSVEAGWITLLSYRNRATFPNYDAQKEESENFQEPLDWKDGQRAPTGPLLGLPFRPTAASPFLLLSDLHSPWSLWQ